MRRRSLLKLGVSAFAVSALSRRSLAADGTRNDIVGELREWVSDGETTLLDVAWRNDLGILEVSAANQGVDVWVPGKDRVILLPTAHILPDAPRDGIVINKAELRLYYFPRGGPPESHAIGIGREGFDTPDGATRIVRKTKAPTWYPTSSSREEKPWLPPAVRPGPDNPLGDYALYLGWPTYLIHGTNKPYGVGRFVSHGCIRMYPDAVAGLFPRVAIGTRVTVVEQSIKLGWRSDELYLQVFPDADQQRELEDRYRFVPQPPPDVSSMIRGKAGQDADRIDWDIVRAELVSCRAVPVKITSARGEVVSDALTARNPLSSPGDPLTGLY
jgi:L,D-transpeptidase ErfK/SrfK